MNTPFLFVFVILFTLGLTLAGASYLQIRRRHGRPAIATSRFNNVLAVTAILVAILGASLTAREAVDANRQAKSDLRVYQRAQSPTVVIAPLDLSDASAVRGRWQTIARNAAHAELLGRPSKCREASLTFSARRTYTILGISGHTLAHSGSTSVLIEGDGRTLAKFSVSRAATFQRNVDIIGVTSVVVRLISTVECTRPTSVLLDKLQLVNIQ